MDADLIEVCGDGPVTSVVQGDQELDADDNLIYVLHTLPGNILGVVLAENTTGTFEFLPTMTYGVTYYICLLYTSPSPRDRTRSRMPSSA